MIHSNESIFIYFKKIKTSKYISEIFCYTYINTHTFAHIKINCVLITIYVCAKAKECVLVRSYASIICHTIRHTIRLHGSTITLL